MKNFISLLKVDLLTLFGINKRLHRKNKEKLGRNSLILAIIGLCVIALLIMFLVGVYTISFVAMFQFAESELDPSLLLKARNNVPSLFFIVCSIIVILSNMKIATDSLFGGKHYEMVSAMPIKKSVIIAEKITFLYVFDLLFYIGIYYVSAMTFGVFTGQNLIYFLMLLLNVLFTPIVSIIIGCTLGVIMGVLTSGFKYKSIFASILYVAFFGAYMVIIMGTSASDGNLANVFLTVPKYYPICDFYVSCIIDVNILYYIIGIVGSLILAILFCLLTGKVYNSIINLLRQTASKSNYKVKDLKAGNQKSALLKREFKRLISSPVYLMNGCAGIVMLLILAVMFIIKKDTAILLINELKNNEAYSFMVNFIYVGLTVAVMFTVGTSCTTCSSISLEGKNLWIIKSLPVSFKEFFEAKARLNYVITIIPTVISILVVSIMIKVPIIIAILSVITSVLYCVFYSYFGLIVNLRFHSFDWENEAKAVKNSTSSMICAFVGIGFDLVIGAVLSVPIVVFPKFGVYLGFIVAITLFVAFILVFRNYLFGEKGREAYRNL